ncbi:hypothetical protein B0J12DRAFT_190581 [Macrophomina phaseolina]|uniref:Uncharacterized protein n=1 Tax=Macrophomina phaseolina TaxID=35725 RepID=A0ABQ8G3D7_9PEZI|nr:hypothetical protein B0J12DRAFT_190581 [Macrophomina phaseolina]
MTQGRSRIRQSQVEERFLAQRPSGRVFLSLATCSTCCVWQEFLHVSWALVDAAFDQISRCWQPKLGAAVTKWAHRRQPTLMCRRFVLVARGVFPLRGRVKDPKDIDAATAWPLGASVEQDDEKATKHQERQAASTAELLPKWPAGPGAPLDRSRELWITVRVWSGGESAVASLIVVTIAA